MAVPHMNTRLNYLVRVICIGLGVVLCAGGGVLVAGEEMLPSYGIAIGNTYDTVIAKLGTPAGILEHGRYITVYYDRGTVDFKDRRVVKIDIVSPEEALQIKREREQAWEAIRLKEEADRNRLTKEGQAELKKKMADKGFPKLPAAERLAYWRDFSKRYPYTDVNTFITEAESVEKGRQRLRECQDESGTITARVAQINDRFASLDADFAASLAHWKRNEINAERAKLNRELATLQTRLADLTSEIGKYSAPAAPQAGVK